VTLPETIPLLGIGWDDLLFMIIAAVMLGGALLVVTMKDIIRCGLAMIVSFAALAGLYVLAGAPFVAAAQVLVYIGAISVLVLFAIIVTQTKAGPGRLVFQTQAVPAAIAAVILALLVAITVAATTWPAQAGRLWTYTDTVPKDSQQVSVATLLFTEYVLPFEVVSILLLAAVIGGVFLAKREPGGTD
jgi:NADH-quinone oxidoreductase subunit J